ncbi:hypothetical protein BPOR_2073g00010 [Botrytis porri]|uniref:Uncharacterized protein n=1 Tax=Botrytis porri TaxID=87229 RepID=A0A4Z1JYR1_9HELO|nr:hypothetical protein BPOR_2073g00010 [Botrytis porri]
MTRPRPLNGNKTNTPAVIAATKIEYEAKKFEFRAIYKMLEVAEAEIIADLKKQERKKLLREKIEKCVAHARAEQNKEEELREAGNINASSRGKKRPERASSSSRTDKSKGEGAAGK